MDSNLGLSEVGRQLVVAVLEAGGWKQVDGGWMEAGCFALHVLTCTATFLAGEAKNNVLVLVLLLLVVVVEW